MTEATYRGVPVTGDVSADWKKGADAALAVCLDLLEGLVDDESCSLDHHGYCQTHWSGAEEHCPVEAAREFQEEARVQGMAWRATIASPSLYWCPEDRPALAVQEVRLDQTDLAFLTIQCVQCGRVLR